MTCSCQCAGIEREFDRRVAERELRRYRRSGPARTTRLLLDALTRAGVQGASLLDIGGGVGAVQHELLKEGLGRATSVDASSAYLRVQREEAGRLGFGDRVRYHHGDFVTLAPEIAPADIVTLDRVICCYDDMPSLVGGSAARARRLYGAVYPRDTWWNRLGIGVMNAWLRLRRSPFRTFVHSAGAIDAVLEREGLARRSGARTLVWQVAVYARRAPDG